LYASTRWFHVRVHSWPLPPHLPYLPTHTHTHTLPTLPHCPHTCPTHFPMPPALRVSTPIPTPHQAMSLSISWIHPVVSLLREDVTGRVGRGNMFRRRHFAGIRGENSPPSGDAGIAVARDAGKWMGLACAAAQRLMAWAGKPAYHLHPSASPSSLPPSHLHLILSDCLGCCSWKAPEEMPP